MTPSSRAAAPRRRPSRTGRAGTSPPAPTPGLASPASDPRSRAAAGPDPTCRARAQAAGGGLSAGPRGLVQNLVCPDRGQGQRFALAQGRRPRRQARAVPGRARRHQAAPAGRTARTASSARRWRVLGSEARLLRPRRPWSPWGKEIPRAAELWHRGSGLTATRSPVQVVIPPRFTAPDENRFDFLPWTRPYRLGILELACRVAPTGPQAEDARADRSGLPGSPGSPPMGHRLRATSCRRRRTPAPRGPRARPASRPPSSPPRARARAPRTWRPLAAWRARRPPWPPR